MSFLAVQWLELSAFSVVAWVYKIPGQRIDIPQAMERSQKKKKKKNPSCPHQKKKKAKAFKKQIKIFK